MIYNQEADGQWWTQQWLDLLNSYRFKKRLERGWKYAREGNVLSIEFENEEVLATVQGTDPQPYKVSIGLDTFSDEQWEFIIEMMAERAIFSAKLLTGEMPHNIEDVFAASGVRLFPFRLDEVRSRCSCPDKANPCKHISAVYYLLGERFSEDPFVLFQLRGRTKAQVLETLRQKRGINGENDFLEVPPKSTTSDAISEAEIKHFWEYQESLESALVVIVPPPNSGTILDLLGSIPLPSEKSTKDASQALTQHLNSIYQTVSQEAILSAMANDA
ncbi:MAG TPA: SWIM zinc finger family protein [Halomicronema sp.]